MFKKTLLSSLLALTVFGAAQADTGFYLAPYLGWGKVDATVANSSVQNNTGAAVTLSAGYKWDPHFAAEFLYTTFDNQHYDSGTFGSASYFYGVVGKGILPLANGFNLFGKLGLGGAHRTLSPRTVTNGGSQSAFTGIYGVGLGYDLNQNVALEAQWVSSISNNSVPNMGALVGGVKFSFA